MGKEIHRKTWMATDLPHSNSLDAYLWNAKTIEVYKWRGNHIPTSSTVFNEWGEQRGVPFISILDSFFELLCNNIEEIIEGWRSPSRNKVLHVKTIYSSQNIPHIIQFSNYRVCNFRYHYGTQICLISNTSIIPMEWGNHIKSFNTLFQPMLNYCRKFEDINFNIFEDMTL